jgi:hypothetical protein
LLSTLGGLKTTPEVPRKDAKSASRSRESICVSSGWARKWLVEVRFNIVWRLMEGDIGHNVLNGC